MLESLLLSWLALIVLIGLMFVKRITLQCIQQSRCSGEFCRKLYKGLVQFVTDNVSKVLKIARAYR